MQLSFGGEVSSEREICLGASLHGEHGKSLRAELQQANVRIMLSRWPVIISSWHTDLTAEEIREKRRAERKQFKLDRAAAIAQAAAEAEAAFAEGREARSSVVIPSGATWKPQQPMADDSARSSPVPDEEHVEFDENTIPELEHLQLTLQEAFFLAWNLDCLTILDPATVVVQRPEYISFTELSFV